MSLSKITNSDLIKPGSFINGSWLTSQDTFAVINPANQQQLILCHSANPDEANIAIGAAKTSQTSWSKKSAQHRARILIKWSQLLMEHIDDLATLITLEQGKPIAEAKSEIEYGVSYLEWFAEEGKRIYGDTIPSSSGNNRLMVIKQAIGVVTAITPWNFPSAMILRKASAALASGCSFVVKPAAETPLSATALAHLAQQAGIPDGLFNVVLSNNAAEIGKVLTEHEDVAKFTFTGSTQVGKILLAQCAQGIKKVSMELGGNAPFIVFNDADIDQAVAGCIASKYRNAGQTCVCTNRILVQSGVAEQFTEKLILAVKQLSVGDGLEPNTDIGPLIDSKAVNKVSQLIQESIELGAHAKLGCKQDVKGNFFPPSILTKVSNDMPIAQQEAFGPIAAIIEFETEQQGIDIANDTQYGLAAYFYSRDIGRVWRVSEQLDFGMIGINEGIISNATAPFGGMKQSGNGREGSKYGLEDYIELKYLCIGGIND